ncbi:uncharacterized protein PG986_004110 [Apiospora aurea]|uniref:Uncharacterized protein n=1 Tax=Apiospora aurea TaxID=335848 RepID=A0ABR1QLN8_9PEZI
MKADFARSQCLSGVMVWAISHDTRDGKYSKSLAEVAPRLHNPRKRDTDNQDDDSGDDGFEIQDHYKLQCRWTNCNEDCPADWVRMTRTDPTGPKNQYMVDNNCPAGYREIGSNMDYCKNSRIPNDLATRGVVSYQAACCTTNVQSMTLYGQCNWNDWPRCGHDTCAGDLIAESGSGSGGALCRDWNSLVDDSHPKRSYCCDQPKEDQRLDECNWYSDISPLGTDLPSDFCNANCPGGTMRVAMDRNGCSGGSAKARCCRGNFKTTEKRYSNDQDIAWDAEIGDFFDDPTCPASDIYRDHGSWLNARSFVSNETSLAIQERGDPQMRWQQQAAAISLVTALFYGSRNPRPATIEIFNGKMRMATYDSLSYDNIRDYMRGRGSDLFYRLGNTQAPHYIVCNLAALNTAIKRVASSSDCACTRPDCCSEGDEVCMGKSAAAPVIDKRTGPENYEWDFNDVGGRPVMINWRSPGYYSPTELDPVIHRSKLKNAWDYDSNCDNLWPVLRDILINGVIDNGYGNDHPLERQMWIVWGDHAIRGALDLDDDSIGDFEVNGVFHTIPVEFFEIDMQTVASPQGTFIQRIMDALGSRNNWQVVTVMVRDLNQRKSRVWIARDTQLSAQKMEDLILGNTNGQKINHAGAIEEIRKTMTAYLWHLQPDPNLQLKNVVHAERRLIREAENHFARRRPGVTIHALAHWDAWFAIHLERMKTVVQDWAKEYLETLSACVRRYYQIALGLQDIPKDDFFPVLP